MLKVSFISVYWLYFSAYFFYELPLPPFETFNDQRRPEIKRIKDILMHTLKVISD